MPLINCLNCGKEISDQARSCVHCGYRKQQSVFIQDLGFDGTVFRLTIAVGIIFGFAGFCSIDG
ncbi:MAG: zinc ribbon domain-containing protein [Acidobacteria bacterium]|nr:zinc ribbon domain-containing protein [Acidobacteriota bacterium]MCA1637086.1 zinc ribbon domain-containing protein [Acidobacteriota bacterium]